MMSPMDEIRRARTLLLIQHPFFGYLAAKLILKEMANHPVIDTMATDGKFLYFNPEFVKLLTKNQTLTGVAHEVMHCVSQHFGRKGSRQDRRWKKACDLAINPMLVDNGFTPISIPGKFEWLLDAQYKGMTAEEIYDKLPEDDGGCSCVILMPGPGDGQGEESEGEGSGDGDQGDKQGQGGSQEATDKPQKASPINWKQAVVEAANFAKMRGALPSGIEELVDEIVHPPVDWKRVIRGELVKAAKTDWSYSRPNKKYAPYGITMPVPFGYTTTAEIWLDTSGSIYGALYSEFLGAVLGIAKALRVSVSVGLCDAAVHAFYPKVQSLADVKKIGFVGRGGTDFRPAFEDARKRRPASLVYCTDGYGTFPERRPSFPTLWVLPHGTDESIKKTLPFGRSLILPKSLSEVKQSIVHRR